MVGDEEVSFHHRQKVIEKKYKLLFEKDINEKSINNLGGA